MGASDAASGANEGNVSYKDGRGWGQTRQGEKVSYDQDLGGEGDTGFLTGDKWKNSPTESVGGAGVMGASVAERIDPATGEKTYGASYNPGRMVGGILGTLLGGPLGGIAGSMLGEKTTETRYNFSGRNGMGTGGVTDDGDDQDSVSEAEERSQQYTPGASKESDTPSATAALVGAPLTAAQRRKRALARSPITSTDTSTGTLLGA
jgi:hypothetical protein